MRSVYDVAAYILQKSGELTTWKLQKLVYYSQAWSLVWDERALFPKSYRGLGERPRRARSLSGSQRHVQNHKHCKWRSGKA